MIETTLPLGVKLKEMLAWIGVLAMSSSLKGGQEAAHLCRKLVGDFGDTEITVQVPIAHILCQACDELRSRGETDAVAEIEKLVQLLKSKKNRRIVGSLSISADPKNIDATFEALRKSIVGAQG